MAVITISAYFCYMVGVHNDIELTVKVYNIYMSYYNLGHKKNRRQNAQIQPITITATKVNTIPIMIQKGELLKQEYNRIINHKKSNLC